MTPCIIESPFRGETKAEESRNRAYLDKCILWSTLRGYTPYASHKMLVDALDDRTSQERQLGIEAGIRMATFILTHHETARVFVCGDYGVSDGMAKAADYYRALGFEHRVLRVTVGKL